MANDMWSSAGICRLGRHDPDLGTAAGEDARNPGVDAGVLLFLLFYGQIFIRSSPDQMPAAAEAQQEDEWTIF
jgi:hypothetical protein